MRADFKRGFAVADSRGPTDFFEGANLDEAVTEAEAIHGEPVFFSGDLKTTSIEDPHVPKINPEVDPATMPAYALKACGLPRIRPADVAALSLEKAWEKLVPFFRIVHKISHGDVKAGDVVKAYETPGTMRARFLAENAKLAKGKTGSKGARPGSSRGPNLIPHALALGLTRKKLPLKILRGGETDMLGLCVGSNAACRKACLLYSGNNPVTDAQVNVKLARTEALLLEPVAWMKMFLSAVEWHLAWCKKRSLRPYLRPNVLSDIPWELVFPEMFGMFKSLTWYDYTKVAGRSRRSDYDLTFSFSGTNPELCEYELRRGRRLAVVFLLPKPCRGEEKKRYCRGLPTKRLCHNVTELTFLGERVLDGDCHDFRPLDPQKSVIGLTYKVPTRGGKRETVPGASLRKFVIETFLDASTGALPVPGTPWSLGAEDIFEDVEATELEA